MLDSAYRTTRWLALAALMATGLPSARTEAQVPRAPPRLRLGFEGGLGGEWGTPRGPSVGVFGQLGLQFGDTLALFYQPSLYVHALGTNDQSDVFLASGNLAMLDLTFEVLQFGVGGGFDVGRFSDCIDGDCVRGDVGLHPSVGGRIAAVVPLPTARARLGIPVALHIHSVFVDRDHRLSSVLITVGIERY